jgi:hypothetical protein
MTAARGSSQVAIGIMAQIGVFGKLFFLCPRGGMFCPGAALSAKSSMRSVDHAAQIAALPESGVQPGGRGNAMPGMAYAHSMRIQLSLANHEMHILTL